MIDTSKMNECEKYNYELQKAIYDRKLPQYKELKKWIKGFEERYASSS